MYYFLYIGVFIFGTIIGSFLNVCIFRIPNNESIAFPPSHCGNCKHELKPLDLVPILSWIFLKGKCRYCKEKISCQYPILEGVCGLLFLLVYINYGNSIDSIKYMVLTALLLVIGVIDFKTQDVYDSTIIFGIIMGIVFIILNKYFYGEANFVSALLGAIIPAIIIAIFAYFNAMGWGDVEIIFLVGLFLNFKMNMLNLFLAIVIGGLVACFLLVVKKKGGKDKMAFGPYIALSSYIVILFGNQILNWYLGFLN